MANLVKIKILGIFFFLISLSFSYILFDSESNENLRFKEWTPDSTLYLSDFMQTMPFIRDEFDARIATHILVRQSENGTPSAYAVMDRFNSCYRKDNHSSHLLNHEAYHANITYIGVKILNKKILDNNLSYSEALIEKDKVVQLIISKQKEYDRITNHSINKPLQHYWEYKIDSTLNFGIELHTIDEFSGATAYFPNQPEVFFIKDTFKLFKVFQLEKYAMKFRFITKYDYDVDTSDYEKSFVDFLGSKNFQDISSSQTSYNNMLMIETHCTDTVYNRRFHDRIIYDNNHEYQLTVFHPISTEGDSIYKMLASRFFDSFTLKEMSDYWEQEYLKNNSKEIRDVTVADEAKGDFETIYTLPYSDCSITYHKPIIVKNEIVIPFKSERHKSEDIDEIIVILNNDKIFSQEVDSINQLVHLNLTELDKPTNKIQFGYIIKSDSINETYHFYGTIIYKYSTSNKR